MIDTEYAYQFLISELNTKRYGPIKIYQQTDNYPIKHRTLNKINIYCPVFKFLVP